MAKGASGLPEHTKYFQDIIDRKITSGEWIIKLAQRQLKYHKIPPDGWVYDDRYARPVREFMRQLPHVEGIWAANHELFEPQLWQDAILSELYGWRRSNNLKLRKYRELICQVGKKNGKSFLSAGIALYELLFANPGAGNKVYTAATTRDQASLVWKAARNMIIRMPATLVGNVKITQHQIVLDTETDEFAPVSREAKNLEGKNPSCVIFDESALIDNLDVFVNLETAMVGRMGHYLSVKITTAQGNVESPFSEMRANAQRVLDGIITDDHLLPFLYEVDKDDDPLNDPSCWVKANPNLDISVPCDFLQRKCQQVLENPSSRSEVLNKHFNKWTSSSRSWLDIEFWDQCATEKIVEEGPCYVGVDLASVSDLCSVSCLYQINPRIFHLKVVSFISEREYSGLSGKQKLLYSDARDRGELVINPGETTSLPNVEDHIRGILEKETVQRIGADRHNAQQMINQIEEEYPGIVLIINQNRSTLSPAIKEFERMILERTIRHSGSAFLRWQFNNCKVNLDEQTGNVLLSKDLSSAKIDSIASTVNAIRCISESVDIFALPEFKVYSMEDL